MEFVVYVVIGVALLVSLGWWYDRRQRRRGVEGVPNRYDSAQDSPYLGGGGMGS